MARAPLATFAALALALGAGVWAAGEALAERANLAAFSETALYTPATLAEFDAKLDAVRAADGPVVALVGDSFIVGESVKAEAGRDWRAHTLDRQLEMCLSEDVPGVRVVNFGMDGMLPADMAAIVPDLKAAGADLIVINANTRSLSGDFEGEAAYSRDWTRELALNSSVAPQLTGHAGLAKQRAWDTDPRSWGQRVAGVAADVFGLDEKGGSASREGVLLLRLKARYRSVSHDAGARAQARALRETALTDGVVVFDTVEERDGFARLVGESSVADYVRERDVLLYGADRLDVPGDLSAQDYTDLIHVTADGYAKYARTLCPGIAARLVRASGEGLAQG